jgi:hypothetical protein
MKSLLIFNVVRCPICHTDLFWVWPEANEPPPNPTLPTLHHSDGSGLEYCPNFGKVFEAPTVELKEIVPITTGAGAQ